jgi:hypothetical protein
MCWGFCCGDGWFQLIWDLSQKLEPLIAQIKRDYPDANCASCGCTKSEHYGSQSHRPGKCLAIKPKFVIGPVKHKTVYAADPKWKQKLGNLYNWIGHRINKSVRWYRKLFPWNYRACHCVEYRHPHPRASQVKEKYGGLRFYMTSATDEMYDLISEAEHKSEEICEVCGNEGRPSGEGWITTLCNSCRAETSKGK